MRLSLGQFTLLNLEVEQTMLKTLLTVQFLPEITPNLRPSASRSFY